MRLKLKVGKRYIRRDGHITGPLVAASPEKMANGFEFQDSIGTQSYTSKGSYWCNNIASDMDLIKEYRPKIKTKVSQVSSGFKYKYIVAQVTRELLGAMSKFPPFNTAHEGYAILLEEVDELWAEVKKKQGLEGRPEAIRKEAIQVAAMALRLILDTTDPTKPAYNK